MKKIIQSARLYFWVIISANLVTMTMVIGEDLVRAAKYSVVILCLSSFGFLLNDLWDRKIDKVNKAKHFEDSNTMTIRLGVIVMTFFLIIGLSLGFWIGWSEFILALIIALSLIAYSTLFRKYLFIPTILTAILASSPLWIPLCLWSKELDQWKFIFVIAIVIMIAGREILMDSRDRLGDIVGQRDTFATIFGTKVAKFMGVILTISACVPFLVSLVYSSYDFSIRSQVLVLGITGVILYLLVKSAVETLLSNEDERLRIQNYVLRSRIAMTLIPFLVLLLWYK